MLVLTVRRWTFAQVSFHTRCLKTRHRGTCVSLKARLKRASIASLYCFDKTPFHIALILKPRRKVSLIFARVVRLVLHRMVPKIGLPLVALSPLLMRISISSLFPLFHTTQPTELDRGAGNALESGLGKSAGIYVCGQDREGLTGGSTNNHCRSLSLLGKSHPLVG